MPMWVAASMPSWNFAGRPTRYAVPRLARSGIRGALRCCASSGLEHCRCSWHLGARHRLAHEPLDVAKEPRLLWPSEARRLSARRCPRGAANAMYVVLRRIRHVEVHHVADLRHVNPPRGDLGLDQHTKSPALEAAERMPALAT